MARADARRATERSGRAAAALRRALRCSAAPAALLLSGAALAQTPPATQPAPLLVSSLSLIDPYNATGLAVFIGLVIFSTTTALLHLRERKRWTQREAALARELADLRARSDCADVILAAEPQIVVSWSGRDEEPVIEGDTAIVADRGPPRRVLAFGSWLPAPNAQALEAALDRLKERGEGFRLLLRSLAGRYLDIEGRAVGARAVMRLREVTGDRLELIRAREELTAARGELDTLNAMLDAVPQPVWLRNADGVLTWTNAAYARAVEAEDGRDAVRRGLELLDRTVREAARRIRASGQPYVARVAAVMAGNRRAVDVVETAAAGGSAGIAVDVSDLEAARADLARQKDAHVRTLDQLSTAVAIFDARQHLIFHNAAYRQLWNLDQAFLDGGPSDGEILDRLRTARRLPEQADFRGWKASVLAAYRAVEAQEQWWHLPDGRTLRVVANPNPQGGITYLFDDVTERFHLESQFNTLIRTQGETLDSLREGVAVFGTDGCLKLSNPAFATLWGMAGDFTAGRPHIDAVIAACRRLAPDEEPWNDIRGAVAGVHDMRTGLACRMRRADGVVLDCAAAPLPDGATLLTFTDVTASVNVERALTERNEALENASRLRDDFVHHVSYELRSPLTNIIGFVQLLGDETVGPLNAKQREYATHIMRSSAALLAIINDILDLASIDQGAMELALEEVDIRETITAAVRGLEDRLAESAIRLEIDTAPDIGTFRADGKRVRQVLFNLLSNAIGFSSEGQTVRLSAHKTDAEVVFAVADQGRGIPPEVIAKVFERFESHTLGSRHRGVGLGLAIVRSFVQLHGGHVELDSTPGRGTIVSCYFPAEGTAAREAAE
ncbi:PAS-domain containing protein [Chelatococcus sp. SYSU_G07232]|uniref:histidine kinase n=1 Tax=Chelatococcus albus TaxID=3047466 RepID=A0ABT7AJB3_9HYPH|nr:PAS domain-containing sensor histidine kinase [Chelatococcus sp. SYSU_G07232]MDJ1158904.1 PAS-domain containing protein [Chelatococcus sp. SYSU_G07232]